MGFRPLSPSLAKEGKANSLLPIVPVKAKGGFLKSFLPGGKSKRGKTRSWGKGSFIWVKAREAIHLIRGRGKTEKRSSQERERDLL